MITCPFFTSVVLKILFFKWGKKVEKAALKVKDANVYFQFHM